MAVIFERVNDALNINPPAGEGQLSVNGSDWLWAVTAVFALSFLAFWGLSFIARSGEKIFHYLFTVTLLVGSIAYFAMASDLAFSVVSQTNNVQNGDRQIFWAKYVYWVVSFPAVILALAIPSGVSWTTILYQVTLSWTWVISYLVAAYTRSNYKWGFYAFGTWAWLLLAFSTVRDGASGAKRVGLTRHFMMLAGFVNLIWLLYPIAWGLSDGGNKIGVTPSFIFFGILDILLIPVTSFAVLFFSRSWDYGRLNLAFTQYGRVNAPGGHFPEKDATPATGGVTAEQPATV